jgi:threonine/homoserine/homoserine lactone efflux protein
MRPYLNGILTGLFLQLAIGPVFFFILGIAIDSDFIISFFGVLAVTIVDFLYISLSILGIGKLLEKERVKRVFGMIGSIMLLIFGVITVIGAIGIKNSIHVGNEWTPGKAFVSCFILTISSPLTIVFWGSVFTSKAIENNYTRKQLAFFGFGAGSATILFLGTVMYIASLVKKLIPDMLIMVLNLTVGLVLIIYGIVRSAKTVKLILSETKPDTI